MRSLRAGFSAIRAFLRLKRVCGGRACALGIRCDCVALQRQPPLVPRSAGGSFSTVNQNRGVCGKPPNIERGAVPTPRRRVHDRPHWRFWGQRALRPAQSAALRDGPMELERYDDGPGPRPPPGWAGTGGSHCGAWRSQAPQGLPAPLLAGCQGGWAGEEEGG